MNNKTISKKHPSQKRSGGVSQGVGLSSNPSTTKKKFFNVCMVVKIKILIFSGDKKSKIK
jgi:hypothetical protein